MNFKLSLLTPIQSILDQRQILNTSQQIEILQRTMIILKNQIQISDEQMYELVILLLQLCKKTVEDEIFCLCFQNLILTTYHTYQITDDQYIESQIESLNKIILMPPNLRSEILDMMSQYQIFETIVVKQPTSKNTHVQQLSKFLFLFFNFETPMLYENQAQQKNCVNLMLQVFQWCNNWRKNFELYLPIIGFFKGIVDKQNKSLIKKFRNTIINSLSNIDKIMITRILEQLLLMNDSTFMKSYKQILPDQTTIYNIVYHFIKNDIQQIQKSDTCQFLNLLPVLEQIYKKEIKLNTNIHILICKLMTFKNSKIIYFFSDKQIFENFFEIFSLNGENQQITEYIQKRLEKLLLNQKKQIDFYELNIATQQDDNDKHMYQIQIQIEEKLLQIITKNSQLSQLIAKIHLKNGKCMTKMFYNNLLEQIKKNSQFTKIYFQLFNQIHYNCYGNIYETKKIIDIDITEDDRGNIKIQKINYQFLQQISLQIMNLSVKNQSFYSKYTEELIQLICFSGKLENYLVTFYNLHKNKYKQQIIDGTNSKNYPVFIYKKLQNEWDYEQDDIFDFQSYLQLKQFHLLLKIKYSVPLLLKRIMNLEITKEEILNLPDYLEINQILLKIYEKILKSNNKLQQNIIKFFNAKDDEIIEKNQYLQIIMDKINDKTLNGFLKFYMFQKENYELLLYNLIEISYKFLDNKEYKIFDSILELYKIILKIIPINSIQKIQNLVNQITKIVFTYSENLMNIPEEKSHQILKKSRLRQIPVNQIRSQNIINNLLKIFILLEFPNNLLPDIQNKIYNFLVNLVQNQRISSKSFKYAAILISKFDKNNNDLNQFSVVLKQSILNFTNYLNQNNQDSLCFISIALQQKYKIDFDLNICLKQLDKQIGLAKNEVISEITITRNIYLQCLYNFNVNQDSAQIQNYFLILKQIILDTKVVTGNSLIADNCYLKINSLILILKLLQSKKSQICESDLFIVLSHLVLDENRHVRRFTYKILPQFINEIQKLQIIYYLSYFETDKKNYQIYKNILQKYLYQKEKDFSNLEGKLIQLNQSLQYDILYIIYILMNNSYFLKNNRWKNVYVFFKCYLNDAQLTYEDSQNLSEILNQLKEYQSIKTNDQCSISTVANAFPNQKKIKSFLTEIQQLLFQDNKNAIKFQNKMNQREKYIYLLQLLLDISDESFNNKKNKKSGIKKSQGQKKFQMDIDSLYYSKFDEFNQEKNSNYSSDDNDEQEEDIDDEIETGDTSEKFIPQSLNKRKSFQKKQIEVESKPLKKR